MHIPIQPRSSTPVDPPRDGDAGLPPGPPTAPEKVGLRRAVDALACAMSVEPVEPGSHSSWCEEILERLHDTRAAWRRHVRMSEGPVGLFEQVRCDAPHLSSRLRRLQTEHSRLDEVMHHLVGRVANLRDDSGAVEVIRPELGALVERFVRHRRHGTNLLYETYCVDTGVGD